MPDERIVVEGKAGITCRRTSSGRVRFEISVNDDEGTPHYLTVVGGLARAEAALAAVAATRASAHRGIDLTFKEALERWLESFPAGTQERRDYEWPVHVHLSPAPWPLADRRDRRVARHRTARRAPGGRLHTVEPSDGARAHAGDDAFRDRARAALRRPALDGRGDSRRRDAPGRDRGRGLHGRRHAPVQGQSGPELTGRSPRAQKHRRGAASATPPRETVGAAPTSSATLANEDAYESPSRHRSEGWSSGRFLEGLLNRPIGGRRGGGGLP